MFGGGEAGEAACVVGSVTDGAAGMTPLLWGAVGVEGIGARILLQEHEALQCLFTPPSQEAQQAIQL